MSGVTCHIRLIVFSGFSLPIRLWLLNCDCLFLGGWEYFGV